MCGRYVVDAIASCAFGVETGSFDDDDSEFLCHAMGSFKFDMTFILKFLIAPITPTIVKKAAAKLGFENIFSSPGANKHTKFLMQVVEESFKHRKTSHTKRNDLIDLMIEAIESSADSLNEDNLHAADQYEKDAQIMGHIKKQKLTYDDGIATAMLMLAAGYETTGNALAYILYELAVNPDCQETLFEEITQAAPDVDHLSYETIQSLPYLDAVIHESMRRHPIIIFLERVCTKEYKLPGTSIIIKEGDVVRTSPIGISYDPEIYPNPMEFNPENFSKENRSQRSPYAFMDFSLGPRNCLAMRFAMFKMKICISNLVSHFQFLPCDKTIMNIEPKDLDSFNPMPKDGLWIKCKAR